MMRLRVRGYAYSRQRKKHREREREKSENTRDPINIIIKIIIMRYIAVFVDDLARRTCCSSAVEDVYTSFVRSFYTDVSTYHTRMPTGSRF